MGFLKDYLMEKAKEKVIDAKKRFIVAPIIATGSAIKKIIDTKKEKDLIEKEKNLEKKGIYYISVPENPRYYKGKNCNEVQAELTACGLENVSLIPIKKLKSDSQKNQLVDHISINGNTKFTKGEKIRSNSHLAIYYLAYKL